MIPALEDGVLPEGIYDCNIDEIDRTFGRFQRSDRRITLLARLRACLSDVQLSGMATAVVIDGSFVTIKDEPDDIDLLIALKPDIVWDSLRPFEYNAVSKRMVKLSYRFDAFAYPEESPDYRQLVDYYQDVRPDAPYTSKKRKGVLRVRL